RPRAFRASAVLVVRSLEAAGREHVCPDRPHAGVQTASDRAVPQSTVTAQLSGGFSRSGRVPQLVLPVFPICGGIFGLRPDGVAPYRLTHFFSFIARGKS